MRLERKIDTIHCSISIILSLLFVILSIYRSIILFVLVDLSIYRSRIITEIENQLVMCLSCVSHVCPCVSHVSPCVSHVYLMCYTRIQFIRVNHLFFVIYINDMPNALKTIHLR
eukprot:Lithocolla_globosa_v1_NODE_1001_length_2963_cov_36.286107.p2 type:complete len:114 gc:universal NODE_1001_length_2963_cov_36.286107:900-1241(+)